MRNKFIIVFVLAFSKLFGQLPIIYAPSIKGGFADFQIEDNRISMSQQHKESGFSEESEAFNLSYKGILGYTISGQLAPWLFGDISGGLAYTWTELTPSYYSGQIFEYYSVGDYGRKNDYGIHLHMDLGSLVFIGISGEVGLSNMKFSNSERSGQRVKDFGTYYSYHYRAGLAIPFVYGIIKAYAQIGESNHFFNSVKWIDEGKKYRNFSKINYSSRSSLSNNITIGFNLTITIPEYTYRW